MDKALLSISQAGPGQLVKVLITLEYHGIFGLKFAYFILTLSSNWYANRLRGIAEHHFGRSKSFSEKAHNS